MYVCIYLLSLFITRIKFHIHFLKYRYFVSYFVKTHFFFWFMITIIALNLLLLATDHYPAPDKLEMAQSMLNNKPISLLPQPQYVHVHVPLLPFINYMYMYMYITLFLLLFIMYMYMYPSFHFYGPMIAFPRVRTMYIYIFIFLCHLREYALYT